MYNICIDENNFKMMERLIIEYIETQTKRNLKFLFMIKQKIKKNLSL